MKDRHRRTIAKTISWRVVATFTTMILVYIFTGNISISLGIGFLEVGLKLFFYYLHERAWGRVKWGKTKYLP